MKNLLFYTFHRQFEEIFYSSMFFNRSEYLKNNFDVFLHCNNSSMTHSELLNVAKFNTTTNILITSKNSGYNFGHLEALSDSFNMFNTYNMVVHLHPDCYIVNDNILKELEQINFDVAAAPIDHLGRKGFTTDFFVFKTKLNFVNDWRDAYIKNKQGVPEHYFFDSVTKRSLNIITKQRYLNDNGNGFRSIDKYGLWHEHNNNTVKEYLLNEKIL